MTIEGQRLGRMIQVPSGFSELLERQELGRQKKRFATKVFDTVRGSLEELREELGLQLEAIQVQTGIVVQSDESMSEEVFRAGCNPDRRGGDEIALVVNVAFPTRFYSSFLVINEEQNVRVVGANIRQGSSDNALLDCEVALIQMFSEASLRLVRAIVDRRVRNLVDKIPGK